MTRSYKLFLANRNGMILLVSGFILMVLSVLVDILTNDTLVFSSKLIDPDIQYHIGVIIEESLKIISEGFLLAAFYHYLISRSFT